MASKRFNGPSKFALPAGLAVAALLRDPTRRAKSRQLVIRVRDAVLPSRPAKAAGRPEQDPAHAPGHRHLTPPEQESNPAIIEPGGHTVVSHHPGHVHKG